MACPSVKIGVEAISEISISIKALDLMLIRSAYINPSWVTASVPMLHRGFPSVVKGRKNQRKIIIILTGTRRLKISLAGIPAVRIIPREIIRADKSTGKFFDTATTMEKKNTSVILTLGSMR